MRTRIILAGVTTALVTFATMVLWDKLRQNELDQISRIVASESYAARSRLVRSVDVMLRGLRDLHIFWSSFGPLPHDQWADESSVQHDYFDGVDLIIWDDPDRSLRFARTLSRPEFDHRPGDEEWARYQAFVEKAQGLEGEQIFGPYETANGDILLEVYFMPDEDRAKGVLIAIINTFRTFNNLLLEDSPGLAVEIRAKDTVVYRRGEPAANVPDSWSHGGMIKNSSGSVWEVTHTPTAEFVESLQTPAVKAVLYIGLAVAVLMGLLLIESGRANYRTRQALMAKGKLAELNRSLEQQVADRTRDLEERSKDLVTISDSVGHDLRNPLNSISANTQLLEQQYASSLGQSGLQITQKLSAGVVHMTDILDRLLSLSTVARADFECERINLTQLARDTFEELEVSDPGPEIDFFAENVPEAMGEPVMVQTLMTNLLSNALKYTRTKADRKIIFSSRSVDGEFAYYVQDNGIGFSSEKADQIFEAFERLGEHNEVEGLGLGLDIASRVVRRHEGRIWAEGKPGQGATVYFTLSSTVPQGFSKSEQNA